MSSFFFSTSGETLAFGDARGESTRGEASKRTRERGADEREEDKQFALILQLHSMATMPTRGANSIVTCSP